MNPKVAILVLNWNGKDITCACLDSLKNLSYTNYDVYVIDNGSTDGSEEEIKTRYPWAGVFQNGDNLGYAEGNNRWIKKVLADGADYVFLVNNDTLIHEDCVSQMVEAARRNPSFGILGPVAFEYGSWDKPLNTGFHVNWNSNWVWPFQDGKGAEILEKKDQVSHFDLIQGDAFFVRREVFEKIGYLDARFFILFEEFDFCVRAKRAGFDVGIAGQAKYQRMKSATLSQHKYNFFYYNTRNFLLFLLKNSGIGGKGAVLIHCLKRVKWDLEDRILKNFKFDKNPGTVMNFASGLFATLHGCFDFLIGKYGRMN